MKCLLCARCWYTAKKRDRRGSIAEARSYQVITNICANRARAVDVVAEGEGPGLSEGDAPPQKKTVHERVPLCVQKEGRLGHGKYVPFEHILPPVAPSPDLNMDPVCGFRDNLGLRGVSQPFSCGFIWKPTRMVLLLSVSSARKAGLVLEQLKKLESPFFICPKPLVVKSGGG